MISVVLSDDRSQILKLEKYSLLRYFELNANEKKNLQIILYIHYQCSGVAAWAGLNILRKDMEKMSFDFFFFKNFQFISQVFVSLMAVLIRLETKYAFFKNTRMGFSRY